MAFLAVMLLALGGDAAQTGSRKTACYRGEKTFLAAKQCVNAWPADDAKFRWPDLNSNCDPKNPACDSIQVQISKDLSIAECKDVRILEVISHEHLAKIRCTGESSSGSPDFFVNLGTLGCDDPDPRIRSRFEQAAGEPSQETRDRGEAIVSQAEQKMLGIHEAIANDTHTLLLLVKSAPPMTFLGHVLDASQELESLFGRVRAATHLDGWCEPEKTVRSPSDDAVRAQRTCRLLRKASEVASRLLAEAGTESATAQRSEGTALKNAVFRHISSRSPYDQTNALAVRMLIFYAFKRTVPDLPAQLMFIRKSTETRVRDPADSDKDYFWELHSGFVFGGRRLLDSGGGYDCSDFVASLLYRTGAAANHFSTRILADIARYLSGETHELRLPKALKNLAHCFSTVDVRAGEPLEPGDLVVSFSEHLQGEHLAVVKQYFENGTISTIEASGGEANTIMSKTRPLFEPQPNCAIRETHLPIRSDLHFLRVNAPTSPGCPLSIASD